MSRVWLDPRNGSWWQILLYEGGDTFPRLLIFVSEEGDALATSAGEFTSSRDLGDPRLCRLLDAARDALVRSAVRHAVSGVGGRREPEGSEGPARRRSAGRLSIGRGAPP